MGVGKPRLDAYQRILCRFYEPLILLKLLLGSGNLGPHLVVTHDPSNLEATQRRFLKNLAYICDFRKGGATTTSICVEEREDSYIFWFAVNSDAGGSKVLEFLRSALPKLKDLLDLQKDDKSDEDDAFLVKCIQHAGYRVKKEAKNLSAAVKKCTRDFSQENEGKYQILTSFEKSHNTLYEQASLSGSVSSNITTWLDP